MRSGFIRLVFLAFLLNPAHASPLKERSGTVAGKVVDERGIGIQGANVLVLNSQRAARTDSAGYFTASFVPPGVYTLRVRCVGFRWAEQTNVQVNARDTTTVVLTMQELPIKLISWEIYGSAVRRMPRAGVRQSPVTQSIAVERGVLYLGGNRFQAPLSLGIDAAQVVANGLKLPPTSRAIRLRFPTREDSIAFRLDSTATALTRYGLSMGLTRSQILEEMRRQHSASLVVRDAILDSSSIESRPAQMRIVEMPDPIPMREPTREESRRSDELYALAALRETKANLELGAIIAISRAGWATVPAPSADEVDRAVQAMQAGIDLTVAQVHLLESTFPPGLLAELRRPALLRGARAAPPDSTIRLSIRSTAGGTVHTLAKPWPPDWIEVTLQNTGRDTVTLVLPGDGSDCGRRTPLLEWNVRELGGPALDRMGIGVCGNINPLYANEVFKLAPGAQRKFTTMFPRNFRYQKSHRYQFRLSYENRPAMEWHGLLIGVHDADALRLLRVSTPCKLVSNALELKVK
jgi:carboxypeptidase family protein